MRVEIVKKTTLKPSGWRLVELLEGLGPDLVGCEVGVDRGESTKYLFEMVPSIQMLYLIDPWKEFVDSEHGLIDQETVDEFRKIALQNIAPYQDRVCLFEDTSESAVDAIADNTLDFIFIDGDHSFVGVSRDIDMFWSKMKVGGIFSGDDYNREQVARAVDEFAEAKGLQKQVIGSVFWYFVKP
jgi:predicted O-methyltransferase YrrM